VVNGEDRSDAPRAVLNSHSTLHTRRGAPFDLRVKLESEGHTFGFRNCSLCKRVLV
jgi:hypothetical protein